MDFPTLQELPQKTYYKLSGADGENREKNQRCQINAKNDYEAVHCWLNEYRHKATTLRTYQKEAERFLLWCIFKKNKALSSLDRDDLEDYMGFLDDPQPREKWCGKKNGRGCKRGDPSWRPFTGGLSGSTKITALSCIDSLLSYLVDARYLAFNPLSLIKKRNIRIKALPANQIKIYDRILTLDEWEAMLNTLYNFPEATPEQKNEKVRLIFILQILFYLGLRINELVTHQWNAFKKIDGKWWFIVVGKGDKLAKIPVNDHLLKAVIQYRAHLNKMPYPTQDETTPIITALNSQNGITARQINKILKRLALETAKQFEIDTDKRNKIKKFSAHWLRHFSASMQDKAGIAFKHIRANHRHENDETTRLYIHAFDDERHEEMQKLRIENLNV